MLWFMASLIYAVLLSWFSMKANINPSSNLTKLNQIAHNCLGDHPYSRIMQDFYHPLQSTTADVPHVLGLTASPIINNRGGGLE